jgi:hypothetical protein
MYIFMALRRYAGVQIDLGTLVLSARVVHWYVTMECSRTI